MLRTIQSTRVCMASIEVLKILNKADRFSDPEQIERLRLLAAAVFEHGQGYGMISDCRSLIEIYRKIHSEHSECATPIIARLMDKAGFKKEYFSQLLQNPVSETKDLPLLYFTEMLVNISDELGNGESLDRLKNRIPEQSLGTSRERISTAIQLFQGLIFQETISLKKEMESLELLSGWLEDIHRQDIAKMVKEVMEEKKEYMDSMDKSVKGAAVPFNIDSVKSAEITDISD